MKATQFIACLFVAFLCLIGCCVPIVAAWAETHIEWLGAVQGREGQYANPYLVFSEILLIVVIILTSIGTLCFAFSEEKK